MSQDYYEILQVHPRADAEAITASYQRLRDLYDPARLDGAADELVFLAREKRDAIERAYAVLSDPVRRATYDEDLAGRAEDPKPNIRHTRLETEGDSQDVRPSSASHSPSPVVSQPRSEELLDYRPLPPAKRTERTRQFDAEPGQISLGQSSTPRQLARWAPLAALAGILVAIVAVSFVLTDGGGPPPAQPTATPSPLDRMDALIQPARDAAQQNPTSAQAWLDLGNILYDSVQVVRENAPDSPLYQQRLGRWLEATNAYSEALALQPTNAVARADKGASQCFYGAATNDQSFVEKGIADVQQAEASAPNDARVLLSLGHCLISASPPRTDEAIASWQRIIDKDPSSSLATQAQQLIANARK